MSLEPVAESEMDGHYKRDKQYPLTVRCDDIEIPAVSSEIIMWDGGGREYPHVHFCCPQCGEMNNFDLESTDTNPRFAVCDLCLWDSPVWVKWHYAGFGEAS